MAVAGKISLLFLMVLGSLPLSEPASPERGEKTPASLYLGVGSPGGQSPGEVIQVDLKGKILGRVQLPGRPQEFALRDDGIITILPASQVTSIPEGGDKGTAVFQPGKGNIARIDAEGEVTPLGAHESISHPIALAVHAKTGDLFVADNASDLLFSFPRASTEEPKQLLAFEPDARSYQNISVAVDAKGKLILSSTNPRGVFRFDPGRSPKLGAPLLANDSVVRAHPTKDTWVAAVYQNAFRNNELEKEPALHVFRGKKRLGSIPYPPGRRSVSCLSFAPNGDLIIAFKKWGVADKSKTQSVEFFSVDLKRRKYRPLFTWDHGRVVACLAADRMDWEKREER